MQCFHLKTNFYYLFQMTIDVNDYNFFYVCHVTVSETDANTV